MRRFIRFREVHKKVGASKATLYRWMQRGTFPRPYPLDDWGHSVAWLEEEVDSWINDRIAARKARVHPAT